MASQLRARAGMVPQSNPSESSAPEAVVHVFTVQRGMTVVLVIETRDWYSGLLQAALARVRIEGLN